MTSRDIYNNSGVRDFDVDAYCSKYSSDEQYLSSPWQSDEFMLASDTAGFSVSYNDIEKLTTATGALVVCLNIGTDPPDVRKPSPCARKECWFDPTSAPKAKALSIIGNLLLQQYQKWQPATKFRQCLDPTSEELKRVCLSLRKASGTDRILFHYNGHGVPRPTENGEIWVFGHLYTHYMPVSVTEIRSWLDGPALYVLDCNAAEMLFPFFVTSSSLSENEYVPPPHISTQERKKSYQSYASFRKTKKSNDMIVLAACRVNETLPVNPKYPADLFTCCLTMPIQTAVRAFIMQ
eukprot:gene6413-12967_t